MALMNRVHPRPDSGRLGLHPFPGLGCGLQCLLAEAPDADRVGTASELAADVPDLGESPVLGKYVTDLVHRGSPPEPAVQVIEDLDGVGGVVLLEVDPDLLTKSSCPGHQATTVGAVQLACSLSRSPAQLDGLTLICAAMRGIGPQESASETTPAELTSVVGAGCGTGPFVLRRVARETTLHGSGRFL